MKRGATNNKGFSLVELIIVIAIMAILVSVMAPQLIKYIEKANVASDTQMADAIHTAISLALIDPDVVTSNDANDKFWIEKFSNPDNDIHLYSGTYGAALQNCQFVKTVTDILNYNPWSTPVADYDFKSTPVSGHVLMPCALVSSDGTKFAVYLAWSDRYGEKNGENFNDTYDELEDSRVIFVK